MTKKEITSVFLEKTMIPFGYMIVCGIIFMPLAKSGSYIDLGLLFLCTSYVFGIVTVRKKLKVNRNMPIKTRMVSLPIEIIGGFVIGIAVYTYAIAVALYYIPITIWSLIMKDDIHRSTQSIPDVKEDYIEELIDPFLDENQLDIMREMQRARESNDKNKNR